MKELTERDFSRAAKKIGCDTAAVKAVVAVESRGKGFLLDGRPKILFEAHCFARYTKPRNKYNAIHPDISSARWNRALYKGGQAEHKRLEKAKNLDEAAALKAASWGLFQIMGFNHQACGYSTVEKFTSDMCQSETKHLDAFVNFIQSEKLGRFLVTKDWAKFARGYNGKGYAKNRYDEKMETAYIKYKKAELAGGSTGSSRSAGLKPKPRATPKQKKTYTIERGDTLGRIAKIYLRGNLKRLLKVNPQITNPDRIRVGQVINLA